MNKIDRYRTTGFYLVLLVLIAGPFFQGLFFPAPLLTAITGVALAFILWAYGRRNDRLGLDIPGGLSVVCSSVWPPSI